jgi:hypothetical protein
VQRSYGANPIAAIRRPPPPLEGLVTFAIDRHAPALEAYPVDTGSSRIHGTAAYVGTVGMFERVGFRRILETAARSDHRPRVLMRLEL